MLKGFSEESGAPFTKEIHSLDEVKSSGNYRVIGRYVSAAANGLPLISGKTHDCFCCEAQLIVTCCYPESESQSDTAYGQTLTICDRETGNTATYTRTISPTKNAAKWTQWQLVATGDVKLVAGNNQINETLSIISNDITAIKEECELSATMHQIATARHYNYMGNYPFSQKVIDAGVDTMILAGYLDFEYEKEWSYSFSIVSKNSNALVLYKKKKDITVTAANLTHLGDFTVTKVSDSPYYVAKCASSPRSWLLLDWENVKSVNNVYDYDGVALSPSLFKNGGLSSRVEDVNKQLGVAETTIYDKINSIERGLDTLFDKQLDYEGSFIANQFQTSNKVGSALYNSSTFSGSGMYVGELKPFRYLATYFKCADWRETSPITKLLLQIKQDDNSGKILYSQILPKTIQQGEISLVLFDLGEVKTFTGNLFITLRADAFGTPMRPTNSNYPFTPADGVAYPKPYFWTNGNIEETASGGPSTDKTKGNFYFQTFTEVKMRTKLTYELVNDLQQRLDFNPNVEISLPDKIYAVVGDTLQLFYRGMIKAVNPYNYDILVTCSKGKQTPRYFEYTPTASDIGTTSFMLNLKDNNGVLVASKSCKLQTVAAPKSPATGINVLCFGDSNTAGGEWVKETYRRLTSTDGSPVGSGLQNIQFCGSKKGGGAGWFGVGGWSWKTFTTAGNPAFRFYVTGVSAISVGAVYSHNGFSYTVREVNVTDGTGNILCETSAQSNTPLESGTLTKTSGNGTNSITFTSFIVDAQNPLWDSANNKMSFIPYANEVANGQIDVVYTSLTWNGVAANMSKDDFADIILQITTFADTLHAEFPKAKLKLLGQNTPSLKGGMGANYGATGTGYADGYGMFRTILSMNEAYQQFANSEGYSDFVEFVNVASQFDVENNMRSAEFAVNIRNSKKELLDTNGVHPGDSGYMQIADVVYRNFVANFCQ